MPQLDTLRAFAVIGVLISHWLEVHFLGGAGVTLFFVLSGYLITGILLRSRNISDSKNESKFIAVKQFYIRRTLRIFPIYYFTIFVFAYLNLTFAREYFSWYATYSTNFLLYFRQEWIGYFSHLWTLAVEEQFYIMWPFVILFIPKKYLLKSIYAIILIGPVFRIIMYLIDGSTNNTFQSLLTPSNMDCFGIGALLAYFRLYKIESLEFNTAFSKVIAASTVVIMALLIYFGGYIGDNFSFGVNIFVQVLFKTALIIFSIFLIAKASIGFTGIWKTVFENKSLLYIGKISYGIYLFHPFCIAIYKYTKLPLSKNMYINALIMFAIVMTVSSLSWFLLEKPINNLKKHFTYN